MYDDVHVQTTPAPQPQVQSPVTPGGSRNTRHATKAVFRTLTTALPADQEQVLATLPRGLTIPLTNAPRAPEFQVYIFWAD